MPNVVTVSFILTTIVLAGIAVFFYVRHFKKTNNAPTKAKQSYKSITSVRTEFVNSNQGALVAKRRDYATEGEAQSDNFTPSRIKSFTLFISAIFALIFTRIFSLQVLSSESYSKEAADNIETTVYSKAPRGNILDREGVALVKNKELLCVLASPELIDDADTINRISVVIGVPSPVIVMRLNDQTQSAQSLKLIGIDISQRSAAYILERSSFFPGITIQSMWDREYPYGSMACHVLGYTGVVTKEDLENASDGFDLKSGDDTGKSGVEYTYNELLSGTHGKRVVVTNARGQVEEVISEVPPAKGNDLVLTISSAVQCAADEALRSVIAPKDNMIGTGSGIGGAVVVMDVENGDILALSSYPNYYAGSFAGGISEDLWSAYNSEDSHKPLLNRVISGAYPAASTYKSFTGLAGLKYGFASSDTIWNCTGSWDGFDTGYPQKCWLRTGHNDIDFYTGITQSCDVVFYEIAKNFFQNSVLDGGDLSATAMQDEIAKYNFGKLTGIDLTGELEGVIPTPDWKAQTFADMPEEAVWKGGDMTNMVIGQGYVSVTPMQLAVAYGAIATGKLVKPHMFKEIINSEGKTVLTNEGEVIGRPDVIEADLNLVKDGLRGVVSDIGIGGAAFNAAGVQAAGKTGTAENGYEEDGTQRPDSAWFVCYAPYDKPKYVCAAHVEYGGGGGEVAGKIASEVLSTAIQYNNKEIDNTPKFIQTSSLESVDLVVTDDLTQRTD